MRPFICLSIFLCSVASVDAQIPIGHYMDTQGMPIEGYFDFLDYSNPYSIVHRYKEEYTSVEPDPLMFNTPKPPDEAFREGYYYEVGGQKISSKLYVDASKLFY